MKTNKKKAYLNLRTKLIFYSIVFSYKKIILKLQIKKMGGKGSKDKPGNQKGPSKPVVVPPKSPTDLPEKDYTLLMSQTGLSREEIKAILDKFNANNPDGKLDKKEFARLYDELRPEPPELIDEIGNFVFKGFDKDNNGSINFNEFLMAYALTSRGDQKHKLEYAFEVYDGDDSGFLDKREVTDLLVAMIDLLGNFLTLNQYF